MNPDDLARILDELANRLGPGGEYVFALAVRQTLISGATSAAFALLFGVASVLLWRKATAYRRADWARWNALPESEKTYPSLNGKPDDLAGNGAGVLLYALPVGAALAALASAEGAVYRLLNPEYAALTDILSRIVP